MKNTVRAKRANPEERRSHYPRMPNKPKNDTGIPDYVIDSIARTLLPLIQAYYSTQSEGRTEEDRQLEKE